MIRSLYTAATGMVTQQLDQDVVANNLANINTVGFKKSRANFQDLMYQILTKAGAISGTGQQLPGGIEVGMGAKLISTQKIFTQGDYTTGTGNQFDWAIEGEGFFQIDNGQGKTLYTRAGNFKVNRDSNVVTQDGFLLTPSINIPTGTVSLTVSSTGAVSATDQNGTITQIGQITTARFANPSGLSSTGKNLYEKTDGSGDPIVGNPGLDGRGTIAQYSLENSNVNVIDEMIKMITGQRAYEIDSKAVTTADNLLSILNNLKR
ncbi:MAG: flagellar basal-body rod protein FlgG [Syntrophales bacterium]|nr:flagellar basal-body rod protein FlgG [Syntrophales bacterium]